MGGLVEMALESEKSCKSLAFYVKSVSIALASVEGIWMFLDISPVLEVCVLSMWSIIFLIVIRLQRCGVVSSGLGFSWDWQTSIIGCRFMSSCP